MNKYSVPARMVGRQARVLLNASDLVVFDGRTEIARHERLMTKGSTRVDLDHYLEVLLANRARYPVQKRWSRPGHPGGSRPFTTSGGPRPARPTVTPTAPVP